MKKAFTITELLVAVGLLAAVLSASTMVFHYSIEAQRTAMATSEIMHSLRAITDQLNADFAGIRNDMPFGVEFVKEQFGSNDEIRTDSIVFFSTGDAQTTKQYNNETVRGNVARIYYGQSGTPEPNSFEPAIRRNKILVRKQVILAPDASLPPPDDSNEYQCTFPIEQSREFLQTPDPATGFPPYIPLYWHNRPDVDPNDQNDIPLYLAKGVDNFTIQLENNVDPNGIVWWPQNSEITGNIVSTPIDDNSIDLIKFTFTLYDSKGILKQGRRFEHIVYIGN